MKRIMILMLLGILVFGPGKAGIAQENKQEAEEKARQEEIVKREKERQERKEFIEQERLEAMEDHERALAEQMEMLEDLRVDLEDLDIPAPVFSRAMAGGDYYFYTPGSQESQTQLTLRNTFRGGSDSSQGNFDVGEGTRRFRCMINGKVRSGEIKISIRYPDGKVFKDLTINSTAEISFTQSVSIQEGKGDKYMGTWKYEVEAVKAEGNYMLQISTQ